MTLSPTHYETLKVYPDATAEQIQASYRNLCRLHHPDLSTKDPAAAHEMMAKINASYEVLSHPERRAEYDGELAREKSATEPLPAESPEAEPEPSRYFIPPEGDEETPELARKPFQRQRVHHEADHREATQEFLAHFLKRVLLIVVVAGLAIYLVVASGAEDKDSGGWLIIRALRRVFTSW
ncbi:MAG: J domain-containing protein [Alphaproteobacteria bacterium]|nr:MAG: J domain-containing protein [Alphaproteobacteria bacterium]